MADIDWNRIKEDHEAAYFNAGICLESPEGDYSVEEMQAIIDDMKKAPLR